jgi:GNAT superfamily N-acetyltransferase
MSRPPPPYRFAWRAAFSNQALNVLHAEAFDHAFLLDTAVLHRYQRHGVATRLVALATEQARAAGCQWLHVDFDEEGMGRRYFDACGFRPTIAGLIDLTADTPTMTSVS